MTKTLDEETAAELQHLDATTQSCSDHIYAQAGAIQALSDDRNVQDLADQIKYWATDSMNVVNCSAEKLGCNFKADCIDSARRH